MSTGEAAKYLGISVATLRRWCDDGKVPHWKTPGGQRRFDEAELRDWREQQQQEMTDA